MPESASLLPDRSQFSEWVADLYRNLYDLVYLRTHALAKELPSDGSGSRRDNGWQLHKLLLDVVEELDPGADAPAFSPPWRRYQLMQSRFVDGLAPDAVAQELAISRRQFFREQKEALDVVAEIIWKRATAGWADTPEVPGRQAQDTPVPLQRLELLRVEAARVKRDNRYARIDEVVDGAIGIMGEVLARRQITLERALPDPSPVASVDPSVLRQMLLSVFGYLTAQAHDTTLGLHGRIRGKHVELSVTLASATALCDETGDADDPLTALEEMAQLSQAHVSRCYAEGRLTGYSVRLPIAQRTVLVLDDNRDVLELFRRYLESSQYKVVTSEQPSEALRMARELHPDVITLDLMMPQQDGWDVLQTLLNQSETRDIPVIVCSVLKQKPLALSLGATAFLEKPVDKQTLVATIRDLT